MKTKARKLPTENCAGIEFIHHGCKHFNPNKFGPVINYRFTKPSGGFWASPVKADFGWKEWCEREDFYTNKLARSFTFTLSENARVYCIRSVDDLIGIPSVREHEYKSPYDMFFPDFEQMLIDGIDAVMVEISKDRRLYWALYGWDCDSILIMNPDIIVEGKKK